ncbi:MAG TPA: hypothetical protein PLJ97_03110, partial [Candidatus Saccharibacteria bacterium]|nr:hypothetical protein [Candidatus Saccharibacteria bacterium]
INIGTGTAAQTITVGSTNGASSLLLQSGTGALNIQTQGTGGINIGTNAVAQTITIGNTTGASVVNLQAGSGNINLNSVTNMQVTSANAFRIQSASAADTMFTVNTSGNQVKIGNDTGTGSATTLLVLDSASSAPTGTAGAMYYNTTTGRIQCYENGSWGACGRTTLQEAYTFSAGAAPSIALNSTNRAFVLQNSASGTISGELFGVRANAVNDTTLGVSLFSITSAGRLGINIGSNVQNPTVNYDLAFGQGANRTIGVEASSGTTGYNLTVSAGNANGSGTAHAGGQISIQGGNAAGTGNAAGGNVYLTGGSGVGTGTKGLVIIDTPTFTTSARQDCASNCTITQANVDGTGAVIINATAEGLTISLPDPTNTTAGRIVYVTAYGSSNDFSLSVNGGGVGNLIAMRANTTATMVWNGSDWTAAGASSSTTLQAAYDNTLSSAGGAEIVLNNTATSNGLTVRNNASNPIIGDGLFEVQTSIG